MEKNKDNRVQLEKDRETLRKMTIDKQRMERLRRSDDTNISDPYKDQKNLKITFANIESMHYSEFNNKGEDDFRPSDIIDDEDDDDNDQDEILKRFKKDQPRRKGAKNKPTHRMSNPQGLHLDHHQPSPAKRELHPSNVKVENQIMYTEALTDIKQ